MSFAKILDGSFIVWHETIAQIDIQPDSSLTAINKIDLTVGVNSVNNSPKIKVYCQSGLGESYVYVADMIAIVIPALPADGSFAEAKYSITFAPRHAANIRLVITKDGINPQELTPVKKYTLYNNGLALVGLSRYEVNDRGWQTGKVFGTIFKYLKAATDIKFSHVFASNTASSGVFLKVGEVSSSLLNGIVLINTCILAGASLMVANTSDITDNSGIEVFVNGTSQATILIPNPAKQAYKADMAIAIEAGDYVSVRCLTTNGTVFDSPVVALYYR